jgi:hypothetical protein
MTGGAGRDINSILAAAEGEEPGPGGPQPALEELSGESLVGSVQRAIDTVASTVGLPPYEVERLLPTTDMDAMLELVAWLR